MKRYPTFYPTYHSDSSFREFSLWILVGFCHLLEGIVLLLSLGFVGIDAALWAAIKLARFRSKKGE